MRDVSTQMLVKKAIADGNAFQRKHGRAPGIIIKRHHDHLSTLFSPTEMTATRWPLCLKCRKIVQAYGIAHEHDRAIEIYAECHGEKAGATVQKPYKDVNEVEPNWLNEVCSMLTFFGNPGTQ